MMGRIPSAAFTSVDFPLPLGPRSAVTCPAGKSRVTPRTTGFPRYPAERFLS